jgi:gamma-glutamyltranspeptidase / glutathione hydrolase
VVNPCCGNIGGGGFMLIHLANGKNTVINFREKAPLKAKQNMFLDKNGNLIPDATTIGYLAVGVPGTVMGLNQALQKYGTMTRKQVMAPAIKLAKEGYRLTSFDAKWFSFYAPAFRKQANVAEIFLHDDKPWQAGDLFIQKDLGNTLSLIAEKGTEVFYKGSIAKKIVEASEKNGGILSMKDFANYSVEEMPPIQCNYHGYTIYSVPPPSSGGIAICEMLSVLQHFNLRQSGFHTAASVHDIVESMRYAFNDRNTRLADPDFVHNPITQLLSPSYINSIVTKIRNTKTIPHAGKRLHEHEQTDTTHYSIMDKHGNAVSVTYTINGFFGAKIIADHTGFFLNDTMDDFTAKPGTENKFDLVQQAINDVASHKRPLSSMSPTIVMKNNQPYMILGSPGGPRIITSVLLTLLNVIDYDFNILQAINLPRFHFQGSPDFIEIEPGAFNDVTTLQLKRMGYNIKQIHKWSAVEAILIDPQSKILYGANDNRRPDGAAIGY